MAGEHVDQPISDTATPSPVDGGVSSSVNADVAVDLGYTVTVDSFSGPLDLLLYLVRRTELDILEVPLSLIIDQFVETIRGWQDADLDVAGDFILMAATLLELKARTIAPPVEADEAADDREPSFDPRESLLRSLLAYRRFKEAAQCLDRIEEDRRPRLERQLREAIPEVPPEEGDFDLGELDLNVLMTTCERLMARIGGLGPRTVMVDEQPLGVRIAVMLDALAACQRATIRELLAGNVSRIVHITTVMASLELARQRFVEIEQPEQFGDIALRLRTTEEREREPELPPEEAPGLKRRRRLPLVTFSAANIPVIGDDDVETPALDEPSESDEARFLRELEEATRVTAVLAVTADVEKSFTAHWLTLHPELVPVEVTPLVLPVAEVPSVKIFPAKKITQTRTPVLPLTEASAAASESTAGIAGVADGAVVISAGGETVSLANENILSSALVTELAMIIEVAAPVVADPAVSSPTEAMIEVGAPLVSDPSIVTSSPSAMVEELPTTSADHVSTVPIINEASSPPLIDEVAVLTVQSPARSLMEETPYTTALVPEIVAEEIVAEENVAAVSPLIAIVPAEVVPRAEPTVEPERVLDVEAWPVMRAMPMPEAVVDPLADLTSEDPAEVNARLHGQRSTEEQETDEEESEELDPDDLLGDDPAMVNAALQAATARIPVPPRVLPELIVPAATETTIWTAPVDVGQTTANEQSEESERSEVSEESEESEERDAIGVPPIPENLSDESAVISKPALSGGAQENIQPLRVAEVESVTQSMVPEASLTPSMLPVSDEVTLAKEPITVSAVEPMATAAESVAVVLDPSSNGDVIGEAMVPAVNLAPSLPVVAKPTSDLTPMTASLILAASAEEPVTEVTIKVSRKIPPVITSEFSQPPAEIALASGDTSAKSEVVAPPLSEPPPPPPPPPSPPPSPLPTSHSPSPRIALTSNPSPIRPMSTPPRSKAWLMIALMAAMNLLWVGWTWFAWVPKNIVEIVVSPQSMPVGSEQESTLSWHFNVDVVDELGVSQAPTTAMPEVVPQVTPPIAGRWHWRDRRTLALEAAQALPLATTFTAVFSAEKFRTTDGFRLRQTSTNSWSTAALSLSAVTIETFDREGTTIALTFNQKVDPQVIAGNLSVAWSSAETQPTSLPKQTDEVADVADVADVPKFATTDPLPTKPAKEPENPVVSEVASPAVLAISKTPDTTVRCVIRSATRGTATIGLKAGTVGIAGPLGLAQAWEHVVPLQQTLVLSQATASVPSHGAVQVEVTTSDVKAPRDLLASMITVDPPLSVTIKTTDTGLSVIGDFQPGQTYRIHSAVAWPEDPTTSGHVLSAYSAASSVSVAVPARPPGLWLLDEVVTAGDVRVAAHAVSTATVAVLAQQVDDALVTTELAWTSLGDAPAVVKVDDLVHDLAPAHCRLRVSSKDDATIIQEEKLVIENVMVRPQALLRAVVKLAKAVIAGDQLSDVPVRVVRLER